MIENILDTIERLYSQGGFDYIQSKYVDRQCWDNKISHVLEDISIDNLTDFNYSTCFSHLIIPSLSSNTGLFSNEFDEYLKKNTELAGVMVFISTIAPFSVIKYIKYTNYNQTNQLHEEYSPLDEETKKIGENIMRLLEENEIEIIEEDILDIVVPNVSLEMKKENVTVYNCLFEDSYF